MVWAACDIQSDVGWEPEAHLNVSVIVSDAAGPAFCPWFTAMLLTLSDHESE